MIFRDRREAGRRLAAALSRFSDRSDVIVLALPRGGAPVAAEVAAALSAPLDVFLVRKLGTPGHEELAMGAIASGGVRVLNDRVVHQAGVTAAEVEEASARERRELQRREKRYRGDRPPLELTGRTAILVDDGLATGATMQAAVEATRKLHPERIVVAVPVAPPDTCAELARTADEVECLSRPAFFQAVGQFYEDFSQTTDEEVRDLLDRSARHVSAAAREGPF